MNLPETAIEFVDVACEALKPEGGIIHYYSFVNASDPLETAKVRLTEAVNKNNRQVKKITIGKDSTRGCALHLASGCGRRNSVRFHN